MAPASSEREGPWEEWTGVDAAFVPVPAVERLHDGPLQLLGSALLKAELCDRLMALGRLDEVPARLAELREVLEQATLELRIITADLRGGGRPA